MSVGHRLRRRALRHAGNPAPGHPAGLSHATKTAVCHAPLIAAPIGSGDPHLVLKHVQQTNHVYRFMVSGATEWPCVLIRGISCHDLSERTVSEGFAVGQAPEKIEKIAARGPQGVDMVFWRVIGPRRRPCLFRSYLRPQRALSAGRVRVWPAKPKSDDRLVHGPAWGHRVPGVPCWHGT